MFERARRDKMHLDLAPLIDVVFQLLIFFMLSSSFLNPRLKLELPKLAGEYDRAPAVPTVVSVDAEGTLFLNQMPLERAVFESKLRAHLAPLSDKAVHFRMDGQQRYKLFLELMESASKAGAGRLNLAYSPKNSD